MSVKKLVEEAKKVIRNSYSPYSRFPVAAVVRTAKGRLYTGVNVENSSYGLTICAERVAVFKAVSEGDRDIEEVLIYTPTEEPTPPCGACRQVIAEFNPRARIIMVARNGKTLVKSLEELLPHTFTGERLLGGEKGGEKGSEGQGHTG